MDTGDEGVRQQTGVLEDSSETRRDGRTAGSVEASGRPTEEDPAAISGQQQDASHRYARTLANVAMGLVPCSEPFEKVVAIARIQLMALDVQIALAKKNVEVLTAHCHLKPQSTRPDRPIPSGDLPIDVSTGGRALLIAYQMRQYELQLYLLDCDMAGHPQADEVSVPRRLPEIMARFNQLLQQCREQQPADGILSDVVETLLPVLVREARTYPLDLEEDTDSSDEGADTASKEPNFAIR
ncbi:uncharacterized protein PFL1_01241 [Pseudozyma flocculosa PF-1]|uniref:uncharacterized protein n=1 Tax=Pseudozyma flocculosa PF-1 TaxID=1277687 RepID=UPI00045606F0|nr:uncharacterized protein PFL1_01241 [Pseudozyma flocculosa PF-1]EPQ31052.1 hypothetical protein PFL1_01241 [Pseudozyma flocculosa PF-1]